MVQKFKTPGGRHDQPPKSCHEGRNESKKSMKKLISFKLSDDADILKSLQSKKNKGVELIKAVKKPKAIDLSDVDDLISIPHLENHKKPEKDLSRLNEPSEVSKAVPNYMRHTRSSGAKKDTNQVRVAKGVKSSTCDKNQTKRNLKNSKPESSGRCLIKTPSLKLGRNSTKSSSLKQTGSVKKSIPSDTICLEKHARKATCSSLLKDSKFPSYVMVEDGASESRGASSMEICTYKYCSLNGHHHAYMQPLKSFISERRRSLKKHKSLELKDDDSKQYRLLEENQTKEGVQFFVDIYQNFGLEKKIVETGNKAESDEQSFISLWEAYELEVQEFEYIEAQLEEEVYIKIENEEEFDHILESSINGSVTVSEDFKKNFFEDELKECCEEDRKEMGNTFSYAEDLVDKEIVSTEVEITEACTEENDNAEDDQMENKYETDQESIDLDHNVFACVEVNDESELGTSDMKITKCKVAKEEEDSDSGRDFNPQEPNYLPLEPQQKAEQVDLKHQDIDERRNSEEWMLDYALRKKLTKLEPVKRKKVELLVEAFESVAPVTKHDHHARRELFGFADIRNIQPCN